MYSSAAIAVGWGSADGRSGEARASAPRANNASIHATMRAAKRTRLKPFRLSVGLLENHLDGLLAWTALRLSNGALEGMNNNIKLVSHRSFGFRNPQHFITAIYHCCARLPLPQWR